MFIKKESMIMRVKELHLHLKLSMLHRLNFWETKKLLMTKEGTLVASTKFH